jgi:predicted short-subunit dehydrogenase-like oxidoreductase (DUF2520 family)
MARPRDQTPSLSVLVFGAGNVGSSLARALRARGVAATLRAARRGLPRAIDADVVLLAVRDRDLRPIARAMSERVTLPRRAVVAHVSGALDAETLAPLRSVCAGVAQMHPMISFASRRVTPDLARGNVLVQGDRAAVARARQIARLLGMTPRAFPGLDTIAYHAAAGLVANGGAALAAIGVELLRRAGVPRDLAPKLLGPLLRSVSDNVERLGLPAALTGPVRRGDVGAVAQHLATLRSKLPQAVAIYLASTEAQLPLARAIGDARARDLDAISRMVAHTQAPERRRPIHG